MEPSGRGLAAVAWSLVAVMGRFARFRVLLSLLPYGEFLLLLPGVFTALVLNLEGVRRVGGPSDLLVPWGLVVPWGLDMAIELKSPTALAAAQSATIFHVLWFAFLVFALPRALACSRAEAVFTASTLWAGIVGVSVVRAALAA